MDDIKNDQEAPGHALSSRPRWCRTTPTVTSVLHKQMAVTKQRGRANDNGKMTQSAKHLVDHRQAASEQTPVDMGMVRIRRASPIQPSHLSTSAYTTYGSAEYKHRGGTHLVATYSVMNVELSLATLGGGRADLASPKSQTCK